LFLFAMLVLVLADNFLLLFVGWEGVGLCSYLLIGYYFERRSACDAGKKAFVVNRIGDVAFLLGILLIFATFNTFDFQSVFMQIASDPERFAPEAGIGILTAIALLLFTGATGKSAQVPLYVWLPDAMAGPTPVSAVIHAATMVTAGVYVVVRCAPIYSRAPVALDVIVFIGLLTAILAALLALVQTDIKRVLAYSTISQLGYMFVAAGVGAFSAAIFHLMTHAFFKALLFLGAGSVIHALGGEQDLTRMGGLRRHLPVTAFTMIIATLAISGIFPLAGFFSKDEILWSAWAQGHWLVWLLALATVGLTAGYMFRLLFLAFFGQERFARHHLCDVYDGHDVHDVHDVHESPPSMIGPLLVLALLSAAGGFAGLPAWLGVESNPFFRFLEPSFARVYRTGPVEYSHGLEALFAAISVAVALAGIYVAYRLYIQSPAAPEAMARRVPGLYRLLLRKFYLDEIYDALLVQPVARGSEELLWKGLETGVIDGAVHGVGQTVEASAGFLKYMQNGLVRS
ncbi:MAG: NADH-quinone oxidoreductase subunit L, partial [Chloroflexi bacterium]